MQRPPSSQAATALVERLVAHAHVAGGWPYYPGRSSRIEPTCWALLALSASRADVTDELLAKGQEFLAGCQRGNGLLVESGMPTPNHAWNGLALVIWLSGSPEPRSSERLLNALLRTRGIAIESEGLVRQNSRLQAWPWVDGTFSWVEPTAYCLLAIRKTRDQRPLTTIRVAEAEAVLLDRACDVGGWNYGNAAVLGQDLRPYVPTTALALLAMQPRRDHEVVTRALEWLEAHAVAERATMALGLAAIALAVYGRPTDVVRAALADQMPSTLTLGNLHLIALALYALTIPAHGAQAFRIS